MLNDYWDKGLKTVDPLNAWRKEIFFVSGITLDNTIVTLPYSDAPIFSGAKHRKHFWYAENP